MRSTPFGDLLARARAGDADALGELFARFEPVVRRRVHGRLTGRVRRRCDTADFVHDVFADLMGRLNSFEDRGEPAFAAWLLRRVEGELVDAWRRAHDAEGERREVTSWDGLADGLPEPTAGPATAAEAEDDRSVLADLVDELPASDAAVLRLRAAEGLAFAEVAERLGLASADAARMRYARALVLIRGHWKRRAGS